MEAHEPGHPSPVSLQPDHPDHEILTEMAAGQAREALGKEVELDLQAVDRSGHWALVRARLRDAGDDTLSLQDTPFAEQAAAGATSDLAVVLFRLDDGEWTVVDQAFLSTHVAWLDWPRSHGAPSQLLGIG
ncbi:hypothetical protein ACOPJQ_00800 [Luteimonas dalianensis]|uniref:hypothetical protein n=1 Tax=Luteimonas dalianensis TaxID=1148196 RepID=UPI003BF19D2B